MTKKGAAQLESQATLYSFRLWNTDIEEPYRAMLESWLAERPSNMSKSQRMNEIIKGLIDGWKGKKPPTDNNKSVAELVNRRLDRLEGLLLARTSELLEAIIANPRAVQAINEASQRYEEGDGSNLDNDLIENLLFDFNR